MNLFDELNTITKLIHYNSGEGSPITIARSITYSILRNNLKIYVKIAESGYLKLKEIYSYKNRIASRIKILEELIK